MRKFGTLTHPIERRHFGTLASSVNLGTAYRNAVYASNPTYWWWADDASGNLLDHAGSNPAVPTGAVTYHEATIINGETFSVKQAGPGIYFTPTEISLPGDFSLEWWFKLPAAAGYSPFWMQATGDHPAVYWFNGRLSIIDTNNAEAAGTTATNDTNAHYIVVTRVGTACTIYNNGVSAATGTWTGALAYTIHFLLHQDATGNNSTFWQMGAVYVGRGLTASEVTAHYAAVP